MSDTKRLIQPAIIHTVEMVQPKPSTDSPRTRKERILIIIFITQFVLLLAAAVHYLRITLCWTAPLGQHVATGLLLRSRAQDGQLRAELRARWLPTARNSGIAAVHFLVDETYDIGLLQQLMDEQQRAGDVLEARDVNLLILHTHRGLGVNRSTTVTRVRLLNEPISVERTRHLICAPRRLLLVNASEAHLLRAKDFQPYDDSPVTLERTPECTWPSIGEAYDFKDNCTPQSTIVCPLSSHAPLKPCAPSSMSLVNYARARRYVSLAYVLFALVLYRQWRSSSNTHRRRNDTTIENHMAPRVDGSATPPVAFGARLRPVHNRSYVVLVYIRAAPQHSDMRRVLRETWLTEARAWNIYHLFVLAGTEDLRTTGEVAAERQAHNDIIVFDTFRDAYHHLSIKTRTLLRWHAQHVEPHSASPVVLVWANLDGFVFPDRLVAMIDARRVHEQRGKLYGHCTCSGKCLHYFGPAPYRDPGNRWYVPYDVWPHRRLPHYCMGYAIVMSPGCVVPLLTHADTWTDTQLRQFWIDDVLYTGVFRAYARLELVNAVNLFPGYIRHDRYLRNCSSCVAMHAMNNPTAIRTQWRIYLQEKSNGTA